MKIRMFLAKTVGDLINAVHKVDIVLSIGVLPPQHELSGMDTLFISQNREMLELLRENLGITSEIRVFMEAPLPYLSLYAQYDDENLLAELEKLAEQGVIEWVELE